MAAPMSAASSNGRHAAGGSMAVDGTADGSPPLRPEEAILLDALRASLGQLSNVQASLKDSVASLNTLQQRWSELANVQESRRGDGGQSGEATPSSSDASEVNREYDEYKIQLEQAIASIRAETATEKSLAAQALLHLTALTAQQSPHDADASDSYAASVTQAGGQTLPKRAAKKRRLDSVTSGRDSPVPPDHLTLPSDLSLSTSSAGGIGDTAGLRSARVSPVPPSTTRATSARMQMSLSREGIQSPINSPALERGNPLDHASALRLSLAGGSSAASEAGTPLSASTPLTASRPRPPSLAPRLLTSKERKELIEAQLPLRIGRLVAFRPPNKIKTPRSATEAETDFFLAKVIECVNGDKNKYKVQDEDDAKKVYTATMNSKSIQLLPDPQDKSTYSAPYFPVGSQVFAMYPDTTVFYRATVINVPGSGKKLNYKVTFYDDNDAVKSISVDHVTEAVT